MTRADDIIYVTPEGLEKLEVELRERAEVRRMDIASRLQEAIRMGDLKENADYHAAKEDQAFNEGRIQELEALIRRAEVIEGGGKDGIVAMGSTVTVAEAGFDDEEERYRIVGAQEADPNQGLISNVSPLGKALIGSKVGDKVRFETPGGEVEFAVLAVD